MISVIGKKSGEPKLLPWKLRWIGYISHICCNDLVFYMFLSVLSDKLNVLKTTSRRLPPISIWYVLLLLHNANHIFINGVQLHNIRLAGIEFHFYIFHAYHLYRLISYVRVRVQCKLEVWNINVEGVILISVCLDSKKCPRKSYFREWVIFSNYFWELILR